MEKVIKDEPAPIVAEVEAELKEKVEEIVEEAEPEAPREEIITEVEEKVEPEVKETVAVDVMKEHDGQEEEYGEEDGSFYDSEVVWDENLTKEEI